MELGKITALEADLASVTAARDRALSVVDALTSQANEANARRREERIAETAASEALNDLITKQSRILTAVANELKGTPPGLTMHSHHDLGEVAAAVIEERDRLQRACDEGLPREYIECPSCHMQHLEWFRRDAPGIDGRKRPHHTHCCYHCGHVWDSGRWSFGADVPKPTYTTCL